MKIYFTASTAEFRNYRETYYTIRDYLISKQHILTNHWPTDTEKRLQAGSKELKDIKEIYRACVRDIQEAELVIIEDTVSNFSTGHQITLALQMRKPTLVLWQSKKRRLFPQMFIHGIESDLLQVSDYTEDSLTDIIQVFINKYEAFSDKNRFHLVLSNVERMYIDWVQHVKRKSRTKVIREALKKMMDDDEEYQDYLLKKS